VPAAAGGIAITLRPVGAADEPFLVDVYASTRPDELAALAAVPGAAAAFARSQSSLQQRAYAATYPGASFDLVLVDGRPAGRLYVDRSDTEIRLIEIALLPPFRGAGIGTRLLGMLLAEAEARGVAVVLHVAARNPAERLYRRLGFAVAEPGEVHLLMRWVPPAAADR
jgi:ribosomal protein S18 acetylase RimI-like enzyme